MLSTNNNSVSPAKDVHQVQNYHHILIYVFTTGMKVKKNRQISTETEYDIKCEHGMNLILSPPLPIFVQIWV